MARRSLRPHLNQIRGWVRQGRTDAWIAHQLEATVQQVEAFKKEHDLLPDGDEVNGAAPDFDDEIDLRAEDDALIAAELEAAEAARKEEEARLAAEEEARRVAAEAEAEAKPKPRARARSTRSRRKPKAGTPLEGTFDHGEEGYGLWLDPAVVDDPIYAEHWAGHRPVVVTVEEDQIVIRRTGDDDSADD